MNPDGRPLVFVDTETATLRGAPFLLELAAVRVVDGEVADTFAELVLPPVPIEPEATEIHGIDEDMVRQADPAPMVLRRFLEYVAEDWMVAHSAGFDARVLAYECARAGLTAPRNPLVDTVPLAKRYLPEAPDHKLETLCQYLDLEEGDHHRALDDATWCWQVFAACAAEAAQQGDEWTASSLLGRVPITVAGKAPESPRLPGRLRALERAVRAGDDVRLVYGEGRSPSELPVTPLFLFDRKGKGYLEAECHNSGLLKTYLLERVQRVLDPR